MLHQSLAITLKENLKKTLKVFPKHFAKFPISITVHLLLKQAETVVDHID